MDVYFIKAVPRRGGSPIIGIFANDDKRTVTIVADEEPRYCMHALYDFYWTDANGKVIGPYKRGAE